MKKLILLLFIPLVFGCSDDDSGDNSLPANTVEGKWLWSPTENRIDANTMYEYTNGIIFTYYGDYPTDTFWNSLDSSDRIPGTDSYTYDGNTLIINGEQHIVTFECDGGKMLFENVVQYWRLSSNCN